jgi:hypothetical protein
MQAAAQGTWGLNGSAISAAEVMIEVPNSPDAIIEHGQCPTHGILSRYTLLTLAVKCCASLKAQFNRHLAFA